MKRYLITGASRGIGRAIAAKLAAQGTTLILHGRDKEALGRTREIVEAKGAQAVLLCHDLSDPSVIQDMVSALGDARLDALINNAGVAFVKPLEQLSLDEWQRTLAVNVTAPFLLTQQLLTRLGRGSTIVNISSIAAKTGFPNWSSYSMSKFALEGFSQSIREELRPKGIRVVNIYPAATNTEIWEGIEGEWPRDKMLQAQETAAAVAYALARPAEVAVENITVQNVGGTL
ncbi:MAG TPA: SDR family NAD(P)-dependent oxidoreductase [Chthoniobacterales bacterium]|jgi:NAD(P)-dependent dehydrogenase (short-subunit alcohol dehydrogenase family)|nr:SDR family NAD(P)-dependent oxidoreductase [Chthoniobacterales bacterium]